MTKNLQSDLIMDFFIFALLTKYAFGEVTKTDCLLTAFLNNEGNDTVHHIQRDKQLGIMTDRSEQTMQIQVRLLQKDCLPCHLLLLEALLH